MRVGFKPLLLELVETLGKTFFHYLNHLRLCVAIVYVCVFELPITSRPF